jgi:proteasome lid subunit RPN8/RPN11
MDKPNLTYPNGRNTYDFQGCGRKAYYDHNRLLNLWHPNGYVADKACYGGACYAEVLIAAHGGANATIAGGVMVQGSTRDTAKMRAEISNYVATNGVLEARKRYPKFQINWFGDEFKVQKQNEKTGKWRTTRKFNSEEEARAYLNGRTEGEYRVDVVEGKGTKVGEIVNLPGPARVTTLLGPAKGQDIRLGVDTDGSAWLTRVDVMDALLKTGLNKLSLYSSAYHKPPPKHKLSGKTIINVTVSGYHPLAETMHRLQWAREARDNGWTVILREVTADKSVFTNAEVKLYNRIHEALLKTDFLIMEQPLHKGKAKSLPGMTEFGLPGCCKGSKLNPHTCDQCEVTEGQGKKFTDFWGMEEGALKQGKLIPDKAEIESVKFEQSKKTTRPEGLEKTKGTARATGAVGAKAVVPKVVISLAGLERGDNWLEFGGTRAHADHIEIETGAKVDVYNFSIEGSEEYLSSVTDYRGMSMSNVLNTQQVDDNPDSLELLEYTTQQMHNFFSLNPNAQIIANYPSSPHHTPSPYRPGERMNKVEMQKYLEEHFEVRKVKLKTLQLSGVKSAADVFIMTKKSFTTEQVKRITAGVQTEMFSTDNKYKEVGTITTLGVGITTDLLNNKVVDFTGKKVESAEDIAVLAQVVRDPKVETFRVFYVKDGVVVHHSAVSSRLPHTTAAFIRDDSTFGLATMKKLIRDTGADSVYLLHNHPVGKPEPSGADIRGTQSFAQVFPEVKAHVIIDSGVYVSLDVNRTRRQTVEVDQSGDLPVPGLPANWKDPLLTASLPHEQLGKRAINTSDIAEIGRAIKVQKDYGVLLMLDTSARVKNIQEIPIELFKEENIEFFKDHIRKEQELVGAYDAVVYLPGRYAGDAQRARDTVSEHAESLVRDGFLADIVVAEGSIVGHLQKTPGMFFGEEEIALHGIRARTEVTEREAPTGDDIVDVAIDDMFGSEHPGLRENLKTWWRDFSFKTYFLDGLNPILDAFGGADNNNRVYKLFRMLKGVHASIEGMMKHGKLVLNKDGVLTVKTKKKGYAALVRKHGQNLRDALRWAAATRSLEIHEASKNIQAKIDQLKADGKTDAAKKLMKKSKNILEFPKVEGLMTKEEATKVLEKYGDRPETGDLSYKELFDLHDEFHQSVLDIAVDSGVISQDQRELWRDLTYVPFYRVFEDAESKAEFFQNPKAGLHIATKLDKKLKGSKKKINEPMENAIANWAYLIQESMRNRATAEAYFTAQQLKYELGSTLIDDISTEDIEGIKVKDGIVTYMTKGGEPNVMSFLLNGERKFFKVEDTALFNALTAINKEGFGKFFNVVFGGPKRVLTYTATFGPAFRVANILRDTLHTWMITPGVSFKPFLDSFHGFVKAMREDESTIRNMAAGGLHGGSYINAEDPKNLSKFTKRLVEEQTRSFGDGVLNTFRKGLDFWMKIGEAAENAARVMRFEQIQREGGDTLDAAYGSRDLLDFSMRGEGRAVNLLISMIPFLNARAQGNYRMYRGAIENPVDFAIKGAILMAASMALWAAYKDDERYKELPDHEKFTYYHWWIGEGEDGHMRMPKPFETGIIFSTMAESIGNIATGNEDLEFFSKFMQHAALETLAFNPVPQALKPIVEVYSNRNMFTGRPIETRAMQALKPGERTSTYTSETLQLIGKGLNISPKKMEALSQGYLSTMAAFLLAGPDQISRWFGNFPEKPTVRTNEFPLIGRFWRTGPARSTKEMTRFYDILTESNELVATVQHYSKMGDIGKVKKLLKENKKLYAFNPTLKRFQQNLSQIRKHMNAIYISKKSAEWKRKQLDKLTRQRNKIVKQAYDFYKGRL